LHDHDRQRSATLFSNTISMYNVAK